MQWSEALPRLLNLFEYGDHPMREEAREELQRMAILLDRFLPDTGGLDEPDPPRVPEES